MDNKKYSNIKKLIAGGCSFTAGDELKDFHHRQTVGIIRPRSNSTWVNCLQQNLFPNATIDNTGISGSSFSGITRRVIFQTRRALKIFDPKEIIVLVMWTSIIRREFVTIYPPSKTVSDDEDHFLATLPSDGDGVTRGPNRDFMIKRRQKLTDERLNRTVVEFYARRATPDNHLYEPLKELEYLMSWLTANKIKFFFTTAFSDLISVEPHPENIFFRDQISRLNIEENIFFNNKMGFHEWAKDNDYPCGERADHPLEQAHIDWAKDMQKWILTK